jgi:hypothetical protein
MKNRYGVEYWFEEVEPKTYRFHMEDKGDFGIRFGGKEGQEQLDVRDLGMFDPSGGPFVSVGGNVWLDETTVSEVTKIRSDVTGIYVEVEG